MCGLILMFFSAKQSLRNFFSLMFILDLPMMTSSLERCHVEFYEFLVSEVDSLQIQRNSIEMQDIRGFP